MTCLNEIAYVRGLMMGDFIAKRDGAAEARRRGSKADTVYSNSGMRLSYERGYNDALKPEPSFSAGM